MKRLAREAVYWTGLALLTGLSLAFSAMQRLEHSGSEIR